MVLSKLARPIDVFNITEWGVDLDRLVRNINSHYDEYAWDDYLFRQNQIEFFKKALPKEALSSLDNKFWMDYYSGRVPDTERQKLVDAIPVEKTGRFREIKKTRKRLIAEFDLSHRGDWYIRRVPSRAFGQEYALTIDTASPDYRLSRREFREMPDCLNCPDLQLILLGLAGELKEKNQGISCLNIIVHHTLVYCYSNQLATNSPEGIHQDGMDYIVSALVIERENITGGKSIIYGNDMKTKILETVLQSGQGILQPDRDTELWHEVTPIRCIDDSKPGYRSTIGFDITALPATNFTQSE